MFAFSANLTATAPTGGFVVAPSLAFIVPWFILLLVVIGIIIFVVRRKTFKEYPARGRFFLTWYSIVAAALAIVALFCIPVFNQAQYTSQDSAFSSWAQHRYGIKLTNAEIKALGPSATIPGYPNQSHTFLVYEKPSPVLYTRKVIDGEYFLFEQKTAGSPSVELPVINK